MGDVADMMVNGDLCESCGVAMGDPGDGYPRTCDDCIRDLRREAVDRPGVVVCPLCGKQTRGIAQHMAAKHPDSAEG